ncbi:hypothetical protein [Pseudoxanthomonas mexicana]|uniref:hypothetical protein n=1 Tax=Pseudoxanthomonas mexicana TaxID=128785 RepID=UPI00168C48DC|nr:hypothetical protein [Pseudoxanthomonas mexicana]MCP1584255.1 hypothetical protein [Pseudoxanthomonas mexicana]QLQ29408.1 MAG: hypothetical protein HZT39_15255 [Pseudoxanthomonas sp.]
MTVLLPFCTRASVGPRILIRTLFVVLLHITVLSFLERAFVRREDGAHHLGPTAQEIIDSLDIAA